MLAAQSCNSQSHESKLCDTDVIIVGCGPTGATLALLLAKLGIRSYILEREHEIYPLPRAVHFDDHVMRVFQTAGVAKELAAVVRFNPGMRFVDSNGTLLLDWPRPAEITENGWQSSYRFHQPDLERILRAHIESNDLIVLRQGASVDFIDNQLDSVLVKYRDSISGESAELSSHFLVGCDGARSIVREFIDCSMEDFGFSERWLVIDLLLHAKKPRLGDFTIQYCGSQSAMTYVRCPGNRRRWEIAIGDQFEDQATVSADQVWHLLHGHIAPSEAKLERAVIYEFKSVLATSWVNGRLLIAGDAAHLTPPFMGQGMCSGIRDVSNLAWKLASCFQSENANQKIEHLLDSYQMERRPHARKYIEVAMQLGRLIKSCESLDDLHDAFVRSDDKLTMRSICPPLGAGLSRCLKDQAGTHVDHWFGQPQLSNRDLLDDRMGYQFSLLIDQGLMTQFRRAYPDSINTVKCPILTTDKQPVLATWLERLGTRALVLRPDRYVLGTADTPVQLRRILELTNWLY